MLIYFFSWITNAGYDGNGVVEFSEPVPFRLTRNLQTFFTPFIVEGLFVSSMCAAAQSIVAPKVTSLSIMIAIRSTVTFCSMYFSKRCLLFDFCELISCSQ